MSFLLDTHVWVWTQERPDAIGTKARQFHKDPADRLLVATARINDLTLVSADERILAYRAVRTIDARR